jgi:hypothetical protein
MDVRLDIEQQMIRYLLGELSIKDKLEMEMEYFTDPEIFDLLQAVEQDLIEGYVNGKLSPSGRVRFERNYLTTPARLAQVRFFHTLVTTLPLESIEEDNGRAVLYDTDELVKKPSIWESLFAPFRGPRLAFGVSMAAALVILAVFGAVKIYDFQVPSLVPEIAKNEPPPPEKNDPKQGLADEKRPELPDDRPAFNIVPQQPEVITTPEPKKPLIASVVWTVPGIRSVGSSAPRVIRIRPGNETVQVVLNFPDLPADRYNRFSAAIQDSAGNEIWRRGDIKAGRVKSGSSVVLRVPAKQFLNGPFSLMLSGDNNRGELVNIREFYFKVER